MYKQLLNPYDRSIPGYTEVVGWPLEPAVPEEIVGIWVYRDGGTVGISIRGKNMKDIEFFFDRVLGRLCYGDYDTKDNAAFIKKGSKFEKEVYQYLDKAKEKLAASTLPKSDIEIFNQCFENARIYSSV